MIDFTKLWLILKLNYDWFYRIMIDSCVGFFINSLMNSYVEYALLGVLETKLLLKQLDNGIVN